MALFRRFHKTPLLSQFFLGMLAIFALPEMQVQQVEREPTVINQSLIAFTVNEAEQEQSLFFLSIFQQESPKAPLQAVVFTGFFAKSYHFDGDENHPIRAGPFSVFS